VTYDDIRVYLRNTVACPAGGADFNDSYAITCVDAAPACLRVPDGEFAHKMGI